jgi:N-acyl-L-homoserine lactone synthetase
MKNKNPLFIKQGEDTYVFRVPYTKGELKALLMLRYRIFRETKEWAMKENDQDIDIDFFDLQSIHFGLYKYIGEVQVPVGHLRLAVSNRNSPNTEWVRSLAEDFGLPAGWDTPPQYALPHFVFLDDNLADLIAGEAGAQNETLIETSRYCVSYEAMAISIAHFMVGSIYEAAYDYFKNERVGFYAMVPVMHQSFYKLYGFEMLYEVNPKGSSEPYVIMKISMDTVKETLIEARNQPTVPLHRLRFKKTYTKAA